MARATLNALALRGEATRKLLVESVGISFPTVTSALAELAGAGLVGEVRREQGPRGRATLVYGISPGAGWVLGVDIGSTQIGFIARGLDGVVIGQEGMPHRGGPVEAGALAGAVARDMVERIGGATPLRGVGIALNQIVARHFARQRSENAVPFDTVRRFVDAAGLSSRTPVLIENNVNTAAVAEHQTGRMQAHDDAAYMQIGVGLGLGFFCDGRLVRGGYGASGELAQIPLSWSAEVASARNAIEQAYGSDGLLASVRQDWREPDAPQSAEQLFARGEAGHPVARAIMERHAVALARIAAAATTILDPSILVLGGGLSRNRLFATLIIDAFRARGARTDIALSSRGGQATVEGAALLAHDLVLRRLVGNHHQPLLTRPILWEPG